MAGFPQPFQRNINSSSPSSANSEEVGFSFIELESPSDVSCVMADKQPQTRHGIRHWCSNSICSNNKCCKRTNPFEVHAEQLSQRLCSPSMLRLKSPEAPASSRSFNCSIEQMADLFPVNFEEEGPSSLQPEDNYEEQSQQDIDLFFTSQEIVPSPSKPPSRVRSPTPAIVGQNSGTQPARQLHTATVWSQTTLSVPAEVDLCTVLGGLLHIPRCSEQANSP
ncbi:hypothetical protein MTO96_025389 [Rhipicephalus appendiculatus]